MLAKKLRAFSEIEKLEIMYEIDGIIINRRRAKQSPQFSRNTFTPSPSTMGRPSSSMSSYSEPLPYVYRQNTRTTYSEPPQIHILDGQNIRQVNSEPQNHIPEEQNTG